MATEHNTHTNAQNAWHSLPVARTTWPCHKNAHISFCLRPLNGRRMHGASEPNSKPLCNMCCHRSSARNTGWHGNAGYSKVIVRLDTCTGFRLSCIAKGLWSVPTHHVSRKNPAPESAPVATSKPASNLAACEPRKSSSFSFSSAFKHSASNFSRLSLSLARYISVS